MKHIFPLLDIVRYVFLLLPLAAKFDLAVEQMDVVTAFLQSDSKEDV